MRTLNLVLFGLVSAAAIWVYMVGYEVAKLEQSLSAHAGQIVETEEDIRVYELEWSSLNERTALQSKMVRFNLDLVRQNALQFASLDEIPPRATEGSMPLAVRLSDGSRMLLPQPKPGEVILVGGGIVR